MRVTFWPFSRRAAFLASLVLVPLCVVAVLLLGDHEVGGFQVSNWILLAAIIVGLLPVVLVVLGGVQSVEAAGVTVAFAAVQEVVADTTKVETRHLMAMNLGQPPGQVSDSASDTVIETLSNAVGNDVVLVDLKEGDAWWETRLLLLAAGAARLQNPRAVVFTAARPDRPQTFLGWARPADLRRRLLEARPPFQLAAERAEHDTLLWTLSLPYTSKGIRQLPWAPRGKAKEQWPNSANPPPMGVRDEDSDYYEFPWPAPEPGPPPQPMRQDRFVPERFLLRKLADLESEDAQWGISEQRLRDLFGSILCTDAVDRDDAEEQWVAMTIGSTAEYFAVTSSGQLVGMIPRFRALNAVLLSLLRTPSAPSAN
jgi:hypothetical protein